MTSVVVIMPSDSGSRAAERYCPRQPAAVHLIQQMRNRGAEGLGAERQCLVDAGPRGRLAAAARDSRRVLARGGASPAGDGAARRVRLLVRLVVYLVAAGALPG
jgi:hypothetical protein